MSIIQNVIIIGTNNRYLCELCCLLMFYFLFLSIIVGCVLFLSVETNIRMNLIHDTTEQCHLKKTCVI